MGTLKELMDQLSPQSRQRVKLMADEMLKNQKADFSPFDPADYLTDEPQRQAYLAAALEDGDPALYAAALDDVERSRNASASSSPSTADHHNADKEE
jgi:hypothetical protein